MDDLNPNDAWLVTAGAFVHLDLECVAATDEPRLLLIDRHGDTIATPAAARRVEPVQLP